MNQPITSLSWTAVSISSNFSEGRMDKTDQAGKHMKCHLCDYTHLEQLKSSTNENCAGEVVSLSVWGAGLSSGYGCHDGLMLH